MVGINEFNIFSSAETFEEYGVNVSPFGFTAPNGGFWATDNGYGYESERGLHMSDGDATNKELSKTGFPASATKTFDLRIKPTGFASGGTIQFRLVSGTTNVFRFAVFSNGSVKYYNGSWQNLGAGTPVPINTWKFIRVVANASTNTAAVYVDGVLIGNATKETGSATTINGFLLSSSGSAAVGDAAYFDDVSLYNTPAQPLNLLMSTSGPSLNMIKADIEPPIPAIMVLT